MTSKEELRIELSERMRYPCEKHDGLVCYTSTGSIVLRDTHINITIPLRLFEATTNDIRVTTASMANFVSAIASMI